MFQHIWFWIEVYLGLVNTSGIWYAFWSGFGSDIAEITIVGAIFITYKHHNCAVPRCLRLAHHKYLVPETKQTTCRKHHTRYWNNVLIHQYKKDYPEQFHHISNNNYER